MDFRSILYKHIDDRSGESSALPDFFTDLNLDQVINGITAGRREYNLRRFFYSPLRNIQAIHYRQEVFSDLENGSLLQKIKQFTEKMVVVHRYLKLLEELEYKYHIEGWFLEAVNVYSDAVVTLAKDLDSEELKSQGLIGFREFVDNYEISMYFQSLLDDTKKLKENLSQIQYLLLIKGRRVWVRKHTTEIDYSIEIERTFEKFKQGGVKDHKIDLFVTSGMNHVTAQIVDFVAKLYPESFLMLDNFFAVHRDFMEETIDLFYREIQFYVSYLDYISEIKQSGLKFCCPQITGQDKEIWDYEGFDLALAKQKVKNNVSTVCNNFSLEGEERIFVITGPNQGGKTTFARSFGQLHYLASLGLPVPGSEAKLFLFDQIFTHFEKEEKLKNQYGKLKDDLVRIRAILEKATSKSIIIMNEIFTSTTFHDAVFMSKLIMEEITKMDSLCICVTFIDELATLNGRIVSLVSTVYPDNPTKRTFKIIRRPADGLAYAISIAEKYQVSYDSLMERIN